MQGKTHAVFAAATAAAVLKPDPGAELLYLLIAGGGGAISDIDISSSKPARTMQNIALGTLVILFAGMLFFKMSERSYIVPLWIFPETKMIAGMGLFICACVYGRGTPHRSFMHSLCAMMILSGSVYLINETAAQYFLVGFATHLILDSLTKRPINLFWPFKGSVFLGICNSNGLMDKMVFVCSTIWLIASMIRITAGVI